VGLGLASALALPARAQQQIPIGTSVTGQIQLSDPVLSDQTHYKLFTFMGTAGQTVQIDLLSADFDAYLYLRDQNGQAIAHDDDGGGGHNARITQSLSYSGMYQILANTVGQGRPARSRCSCVPPRKCSRVRSRSRSARRSAAS